MRVPLHFPDFDEDFRYMQMEDNSQRNMFIENVVAGRMAVVWNYLVHKAYSEFRGLGRENRASPVYWIPSFAWTALRAELAPTRSFYPFIGLPGPKGEGWRQEKCLSVGLWLSPPDTLSKESGHLLVSLLVERARPVQALLAMWQERRQELKALLGSAHAGISFGARGHYLEPDALDDYRLGASRKHWLRLGSQVKATEQIDFIPTTFLALVRIYHVLQGVIRGDRKRLDILVHK